MKQFFAFAGLFAVLTVSAQQAPQNLEDSKPLKEMSAKKLHHHKGFKKQHRTVEQQIERYNKYNLSATQKEQIKSLHESREKEIKKQHEKRQQEFAKLKDQRRKDFQKKQADFDKKMEKIMDKEQFLQYQQDRAQHQKHVGQRGEHRQAFKEGQRVK